MTVETSSCHKVRNADCAAVICICGSDIDDNGTIQCDNCGRWQHMRCVGITGTEDVDDMVYLCDICSPRYLDVEAARAYINQYQREEAQAMQVKTRRGRGKGASKRGSHANHNTRPDKRARSSKQVDSDATDDATETTTTNSASRDFTLIDTYKTTEDAFRYINHNINSFPTYPSDAVSHPLATSIRPVSKGQSQAVFVEADAVAGTYVASYLGLVDTKDNYVANPQNKYQYLRGPTSLVVFAEQTMLAIDARSVGNDYRYLRKSCSPNCQIAPLTIASENNEMRLWQLSIILLSDVKIGDELCVGYQWEGDVPERIPGLDNDALLCEFAQNINSIIGTCACSKRPEDCSIRKFLVKPIDRRNSPPSESQEAPRIVENGQYLETRRQSTDLEQPMTREERKIQMAIARMENADAPKVKRRRRNTGDETNRPANSRRISTNVPDEPRTPVEDPRRSESPIVGTKPSKIKTTMRSRAKLIRSPSPDYNIHELLPHKVLWLRVFSKDKEKQDQVKAKIAVQAKEAAERLEKEATQKKLELEARARDARDAKERELEAARLLAEKEAVEASQRAREREIWGDHPVSQVLPKTEPSTTVPGDDMLASPHHHKTPSHINVSASNPSSPLDSPTGMGPPATSADATSTTLPVVPKIVKKLSVSEYMRQRKERAANDACESPGSDGRSAAPPQLLPTSSQSNRCEDEKSDGEIEAGEVGIKEEHTTQQLPPMIPAGPRDHQQVPPGGPRGSSWNPPGSAGYQSRPTSHHNGPSNAHSFSFNRNHSYSPDQRTTSFNNSNGNSNSNHNSNNNNTARGLQNAYPISGHAGSNTNHQQYQNYPRAAPPTIPTGPKAQQFRGSETSNTYYQPPAPSHNSKDGARSTYQSQHQ